jgi:hypothetical protein
MKTVADYEDEIEMLKAEIQSQHARMVVSSRANDKLYEMTKHHLTLDQLSEINIYSQNRNDEQCTFCSNTARCTNCL